MDLITLPIADLSSDPANARKHSARNLDAIKASLRRFGQQKPIVIDSNNVVRAGNGTLAAARQLGWTHIAAVRSDLPLAELTAYAIADNRTAELAEWDDEILSALLHDPAMGDVGFTNDEVSKLLGDHPLELTDDKPQIETLGEKYEVIVECRDEEHQQKVFEQLSQSGETCRLLTL